MRTTRANYWSCSNFARRVSVFFGAAPKLECGTSDEWRRWRKSAKTEHPYVFWFNEVLLDTLQDVVNWPNDVLCNVRYYLYNRFIAKTHYCRTGLKPGEYHELDTRFLHGLFEELVDFVEVESAWHRCVWDDEEAKKYMVPWWRRGWYPLRWFEWRCPEAGIAHLEWAATLKNDYEYYPENERSAQPDYMEPTHQAIAAIEQLALYNWWKNIRPARKDPYDVSGWSEYCDSRRNKAAAAGDNELDSMFDDQKTDEERAVSQAALESLHQIEKQYDDEDTDYLIRLIKARHDLWT